MPAGSIEIGETPAQAVIREVWEETGLQVIPQKLLGVFGGKDFRFTYPDGNKVEYIVLFFECSIKGGVLHPIDGESAELRFFDASAMPKFTMPYPEDIFCQTDSDRTYFQL